MQDLLGTVAIAELEEAVYVVVVVVRRLYSALLGGSLLYSRVKSATCLVLYYSYSASERACYYFPIIG